MVSNKKVFLTLVTILALASFGFTSFGAFRSIPASTSLVAVQSLPVASSNAITTHSNECNETPDGDGNDGCTDDETPDGDADDVPAMLTVSSQLAGVCALDKQPAGTQVVSVDGAYEELAYPYYKVTLAIPTRGDLVVYVNGANCNVIPAP